MNWPNDALVQRALFVSAIGRWQSIAWLAMVVAAIGTIVAFGSQPMGWPEWVAVAAILIGLIGEGVFVGLYVTDADRQISLKISLCEARVFACINGIQDKQLQATLLKANRYWLRIHETIDALASEVMHDRLKHLKQDSTHWLQTVCTLALRLDQLKLDVVSDRDLLDMFKATPDSTSTESTHLALLKDNLASISDRLDTIMAAFHDVQVGLLLIKSQRYSSGRITRLQDEISEQADQLNDLLLEMNQ